MDGEVQRPRVRHTIRNNNDLFVYNSLFPYVFSFILRHSPPFTQHFLYVFFKDFCSKRYFGEFVPAFVYFIKILAIVIQSYSFFSYKLFFLTFSIFSYFLIFFFPPVIFLLSFFLVFFFFEFIYFSSLSLNFTHLHFFLIFPFFRPFFSLHFCRSSRFFTY